MRIAIGEFKQESNTFAAVPTTLRDFEAFHLWRGDDVVRNMRGTNTEVAGFIDVCDREGYTVVPALAAFAVSGAPVTADTYSALQKELLERLAGARPFDGVLLALHGAMVAEGEDDPDGLTLQAVRQLIGPDVPLVVTMDLHANITRRCIEAADAIVGFRTCPHIDLHDTGLRAARILARCLHGESKPSMTYVKIPMVTPASLHVHFLEGPFKNLMDATLQAEQRDDAILSASAFTVQPWLDIPDMGYATVVVADRDRAAAEQVACSLAQQAWNDRHALMDINLVAPDEAIQRALAHPTGPVILSDLADGTGAGSPGDSTSVIAALLRADPDKTALIYVCDPEVAAEAAAAGVGGQIDTLVGGKRDNVFNKPVRYTGVVEFSQSVSFRFEGQGYTGATMDMGLSAVIRHNNIYLLVSSNPVMTVDPGLYKAVGLEPAGAQIVVVKSHIQFRGGYAGIAQDIMLLDSPGMSSDHLTSLDFRRVDRPLFPFDPDIDYRPAPAGGRGEGYEYDDKANRSGRALA